MRVIWGSWRSQIAAALLPLLLFAEQVALGMNGPVLGAAAAVLEIVLAIVMLLLLRPDAGFWTRAWPVFLFVAASLVWIALPAVAPGLLGARSNPYIAPDLVLSGLVRGFGTAAVLLAGAFLGYRRGLMRIALAWLVGLGNLLILVGLWIREFDPAHVWGYQKGILLDRFTGTLLNANASGCVFGVIALLGLGLTLALLRERDPVDPQPRETVQQVIAALAIVGGIGACAITGSRTALLLTLLIGVTLALSDRALRRFFQRGFVIGVASALLLAAIAIFVSLDTGLDRLVMAKQDGADRVILWNHYYEMAAASPWFGYGPLAFSEANLASLQSMSDASNFWYVNAPHNVVLSLLLQGGWPYLILISLAIAIMFAHMLLTRRQSRADPRLKSVIGALLLILGCSIVDIALDVPAIVSLATALLAMGWGRALRISADRQEGSENSAA